MVTTYQVPVVEELQACRQVPHEVLRHGLAQTGPRLPLDEALQVPAPTVLQDDVDVPVIALCSRRAPATTTAANTNQQHDGRHCYTHSLTHSRPALLAGWHASPERDADEGGRGGVYTLPVCRIA